MWGYHANRMDALRRRSQLDLGTLEEWTRTFSRGQECIVYKKKYVLSNSESVQCNFSFFDHVMKVEWFFTEIWRYIHFQNGDRPPSWNCFTTIRDHPRSPCQILCQSDTQIWRYSCLNFLHIWLEMPIQVPKIGVLGDFGPLTVIIHHRDSTQLNSTNHPKRKEWFTRGKKL